jgi:hypothetical protein
MAKSRPAVQVGLELDGQAAALERELTSTIDSDVISARPAFRRRERFAKRSGLSRFVRRYRP